MHNQRAAKQPKRAVQKPSKTKAVNKRRLTTSVKKSNTQINTSSNVTSVLTTQAMAFTTTTPQTHKIQKVNNSSPFSSTISHISSPSPQLSMSTTPPMTPIGLQKRNMATFKKVGNVQRAVLTAEQLTQEKEKKAEAEAAKPKKIPSLNDLMRQLYKKIHPDLMMAYPEQREQNEKSLGTFQNFLGLLKQVDGNEKYPVLKNAILPFYLRTATPGHFQRVELFLHTDSTMNKKGIEKQLATFFKSINLSSQFKWDDEYFPFKGKPNLLKDENAEGAGDAEAPDASSGPTGSETYEQFMERIKKEGEKQSKQNSTM